MKRLDAFVNPYGDDKIHSNCGLFGIMDTARGPINGRIPVEAMANLHERGNGLGGGFAGYGIYPDFSEYYALHLLYESKDFVQGCEDFIESRFEIEFAEPIPTRPTPVLKNPPLFKRYFVKPKMQELRNAGFESAAGGVEIEVEANETQYVVDATMRINTEVEGAYVLSAGKDMGVFKGVGYPEDIGEFFKLETYEGYLWTGHGRFPTNTVAWWGGAHPFSVADWTVVHNGEISSYGTNRNFLEMYGYDCALQTDTEVVAYAADLMVRKHGLSIEEMAFVFAPAFWDEIDRMPEAKRQRYQWLRRVYSDLLLNGPFTVIIARTGQMIGLADRVRLRPLVVAERGSLVMMSSEEAAIRTVCPNPTKVWTPIGGEPIVRRLDGDTLRKAS